MSVVKKQSVTKAWLNSAANANTLSPGDFYVVERDGTYQATSGSTFVKVEQAELPELGSAAFADVSDFATAAQGSLAESALQQVKTINGQSLVGTGNVMTLQRKFRRFTSSGTFTPTAAHLAAGGVVDYVIVGGGGGGGKGITGASAGAGGGGGSVIPGTIALTGAVSVVIGSGGAGASGTTIATARGASGGQSSFGTLIALGGGGGGGSLNSGTDAGHFGLPGGCGGGDGGSTNTCGGGGGALHSASYVTPSATGVGANGGSGAGRTGGSAGGAGFLGFGRGGNGATASGAGASANANTGNGGDGGAGGSNGGAGGSGVVELTWFE